MPLASWLRIGTFLTLVTAYLMWMSQILSNGTSDPRLLERAFTISNLVEAGLWVLIAVGLTWAARREQKRVRQIWQAMAVTLTLFGVSDVIEVFTRAWWRPWWLFLWKALCVTTIAGLLILYWQQRQRD